MKTKKLEMKVSKDMLLKIKDSVIYSPQLPDNEDEITDEFLKAACRNALKAEEGHQILETMGKMILQGIAPYFPIDQDVKLTLTVSDMDND